MGKHKSNFGVKISAFLRELDSYGHPISLKYKKSPNYKSTFGGIFSILSNIMIVSYFAYQVSNVIMREQTTVTYSIFNKNLAHDNNPIKLTRDKFDFTLIAYFSKYSSDFNATYRDTIQPNIDQYFNFVAYEAEIILPDSLSNNDESYSFQQTMIPLQKCGNNSFPDFNYDSNYDIKILLQNYYCPLDNFTASLQGAYSSKSTKILNIDVRYCDQQQLNQLHPGKNLTCKSVEESNTIIPYMQFRLSLLSEYFDVKEYNTNPIKKKSRLLAYSSSKESGQTTSFKVSQNYAILYDSKLLPQLNPTNTSFMDIKTDYASNSHLTAYGSILMFSFAQDEGVQTIERKAFTLFDALSNAGGLMGTIFAIVSFLISGVQEQLFLTSIMKRLFIYEKQESTSDQEDHQIQPKYKSALNKVYNMAENERSRTINNDLTTVKALNLETEKDIPDQSSIMDNSNDILNFDLLLKYMQSLMSFAFTYKESIVFKIRFVLKIFCRRLKHTYKEQLYIHGKEKIEKEFDITRILKSLRRVELLEQIILFKYQTFFFPYLKQNVLTTSNPHTLIKKQSKMDNLNSDQTKIYMHQLLIHNSERINTRILENLGHVNKTEESDLTPGIKESNEELSQKVIAKKYNDFLEEN